MPKWNHKIKTEISEIAPGLHVIVNASSKTRVRLAFLLQHGDGNILFHGPDNGKICEEITPPLEALGGIKHHLLTHYPEATKACKTLAETFSCSTNIHETDAPVAEYMVKDFPFEHFKGGGEVLPGVEAHHLPGHTAGFTAFQFSIGGERYLICGDIVSELNAGWKPRIAGDLIHEGLESISRFMKMDVDWLLPNQVRADRALPPIATREIVENIV